MLVARIVAVVVAEWCCAWLDFFLDYTTPAGVQQHGDDGENRVFFSRRYHSFIKKVILIFNIFMHFFLTLFFFLHQKFVSITVPFF